jgi:ribonuclease E
MALSFLRKVHGAAAKGTVSEVHGGLPLEVAYYLLNRKKRELTQIENDYEIEVTVKGKTSYLLNQLELETVKRDIPRPEDLAKSEAEAEEAHKPVIKVDRVEKVADKAVAVDQAVEAVVPAEGAKKRKRRRKKKKGTGDATVPAEQAETTADAEDQDVETEVTDAVEVENNEAGADDALAKPKKRKRRRGRKGPKLTGDVTQEAGAAGEIAAIQPATEIPAVSAEAAAVDLPVDADKPKRSRPARVRKKPAADVIADIPVPEVKVAAEPAPAPKPRRRPAAKKIAVVVSPPPETTEAMVKPPAKARRKKKDEVSE